MDTALLIQAFGGLFAIMNPFVALPMSLALTDGQDAKSQRSVAVRVALGCAVMAAIIIVSGSAVLSFFGVSVNAFRIAGGLVLLTIALGMLNGNSASHTGNSSEQAHHAKQASQGDVAFYPLTFPMIMGPGTITTIIVFISHADHSMTGYVTVGVATAIVLALLFLVLWFAPNIGHHMSQTLRIITTRLMGMILAGIAISMMIAGLAAVFPGLLGR